MGAFHFLVASSPELVYHRGMSFLTSAVGAVVVYGILSVIAILVSSRRSN